MADQNQNDRLTTLQRQLDEVLVAQAAANKAAINATTKAEAKGRFKNTLCLL